MFNILEKNYFKQFIKGHSRVSILKSCQIIELRMLSDWTKATGMMILIFWIIVPTFDQYSDILMVTRLFSGPDPDLHVQGGQVKQHQF